MEITLSPSSTRTMAKRLRSVVPGMTASAALEALAVTLGHPNWDTLSALVEKAAAPVAEDPEVLALKAQVAWRNAPPVVKVPFTMYWAAFQTNEHDEGPSWLRVEVTQGMVDELHEMQSLCLKNRCDLSRDLAYGEWSDEGSYNLQCEELCVTKNRFWARGLSQYGDGATETRGLEIAAFFDAVEKGSSQSTQQMGWAEDILFATSSFAAEFAQGLFDCADVDISQESITAMP